MGKYFDLLVERKKVRDNYLGKIDYYLNLIKRRAIKLLGKDTKVLLFGSYLSGNFGPNSDVDILIIYKKKINPQDKSKIILRLLKGFKTYHPFEIHLANQEEFENWYKNFLKENYREI